MVIKISWEWNDWIKSSSWDLYVKFSVDLSEKNLTRKGYDLHYDLEIDVLEAILWTVKELNIPVIWKRSIKIDAWTQFWSIIKMSWDWVKHIDKDKKWDLFIALNDDENGIKLLATTNWYLQFYDADLFYKKWNYFKKMRFSDYLSASCLVVKNSKD